MRTRPDLEQSYYPVMRARVEVACYSQHLHKREATVNMDYILLKYTVDYVHVYMCVCS